MSMSEYMTGVGQRARAASHLLVSATTAQKNDALTAMAAAIEQAAPELLAANAIDMGRGEAGGLDAALLDRLALDEGRVCAMADGLRQIAALPDPVGQISCLDYRPSGIQVGRMRVPLGVIGIIYESRPNVTADAAGLCLKSGNAAILRGGSEAIESNRAIAACIQRAITSVGLPADAVQVVDTTDRAAVGELVRLKQFVDIIVPRGGQGLIDRVSSEARMPVLKHLNGICHVYVDDRADPEKAIAVAYNAKTQRYGTCNTMETLLIAEGIASKVLPELEKRYRAAGVELRGCPATQALIDDIVPATEADWGTEYLAPILSIRLVADIDAAMDHIREYGSGHTESMISEDITRCRRFLREVDSSSVMINVSTRFADGYEYGLGAEIGISTDKLHARGPVGLEGLTSLKYVVLGDGHIRG